MTAEEYMRVLWLDCRDQGKPLIAAAKVVVDAFEKTDKFDRDRGELWERRLTTCPGHDDGGGRQWCAYCGDIKADSGGVSPSVDYDHDIGLPDCEGGVHQPGCRRYKPAEPPGVDGE